MPPDKARMLRKIFEAVIPGWHMNKEHWNTVLLDTLIPRQDIERMIDVSNGLVRDKIKKNERLGRELKHGKWIKRWLRDT